MQTVHLYEDAYVKYLLWSRNATLFVLGLLLGMGLYFALARESYVFDLHQSLQASQEVVEGLSTERDQLKAELEKYEAKRDKLAAFMRTVNKDLTVAKSKELATLEIRYAKISPLPDEVDFSIAYQETHFNPEKTSYTGCCFGYRQIYYKVHKEEYDIPSKQSLFNAHVNIDRSTRMLVNHFRKYKTVRGALGRYYGSTVPEENEWYASQVLAKAKVIKRYVG